MNLYGLVSFRHWIELPLHISNGDKLKAIIHISVWK